MALSLAAMSAAVKPDEAPAGLTGSYEVTVSLFNKETGGDSQLVAILPHFGGPVLINLDYDRRARKAQGELKGLAGDAMNKGTEKPRIDSDADGFVTYDSPSQGPTVIGRFRPWGGVNVNDTRKMIEIDGKSFHVPSNLTPGAAVVNLVYPVDGRFMRNRGEQGYGKNFFAHVAEVRNALIAAQTAPTKTAKDKAAATDLNATAQRGLNRIVTYIADVYPRDLTFVGGELAHTTPLGEAVVNELQAGLNPRFSTGATTRARRTERPTTLLDGE